jgi:pimeloyl-ACP methyl ester carboxylesterase
MTAYIAESDVPVLLLVGEHDAVTPPHIVEKAAGKVRGARFQVLPNAGHSSYFEQAAAFNAAVLAYLRELEAAEAARTEDGIAAG